MISFFPVYISEGYHLTSSLVPLTSPDRPPRGGISYLRCWWSWHFQCWVYWPVSDNQSWQCYRIMTNYLHVGTYLRQQCLWDNEALHRNQKRDTWGLPGRHSPVIQMRSSWFLPKSDNSSTSYTVSSCFGWMHGPMRYQPLFRKAADIVIMNGDGPQRFRGCHHWWWCSHIARADESSDCNAKYHGPLSSPP